jgi:polyferredoxin
MNKGTIMKEIILLLLIMIFLAGCIPGDDKHTPIKPAGFFWGIWHGWIAPISLIVQIFNNDIRVYERNNSGWWYDFGFYIAILGGFGGISLTRKRKKKQ